MRTLNFGKLGKKTLNLKKSKTMFSTGKGKPSASKPSGKMFGFGKRKEPSPSSRPNT